MTAPNLILLDWPQADYDNTALRDDGEPEPGHTPYVRRDPEALAASPEVQALVMRAVLDGQLRALERGRLDTPDELRAIRAGTEGVE